MKAYFYCYLYELKNSAKFGFKILKREAEFYYATPDNMNGKVIEILRQGEDEVHDLVVTDPGQVEFLYVKEDLYGNFIKSSVFKEGDLVRISVDI